MSQSKSAVSVKIFGYEERIDQESEVTLVSGWDYDRNFDHISRPDPDFELFATVKPGRPTHEKNQVPFPIWVSCEGWAGNDNCYLTSDLYFYFYMDERNEYWRVDFM